MQPLPHSLPGVSSSSQKGCEVTHKRGRGDSECYNIDMATVKYIGRNTLIRAFNRNPAMVSREGKRMLQRGMAHYKRGIINRPWRMGSRGGGAPVSDDPSIMRTGKKHSPGNLRDTHRTSFSGFRASIYPTADYAGYVHGLNGKKVNKRGVQLRPWLDHVKKEKDPQVKREFQGMLKTITKDLSK